MKSGKKILRELLLDSGRTDTVRARLGALRKGGLRSLISHLTKQAGGPQTSEEILGLAMCEVVRRFMEEGKEIL